jgi:hypothetical protein
MDKTETRTVGAEVKVTLRLTVSQSVCLGVMPKSGKFDQSFFFYKVTVLSFWGALSDERPGLSSDWRLYMTDTKRV